MAPASAALVAPESADKGTRDERARQREEVGHPSALSHQGVRRRQRLVALARGECPTQRGKGLNERRRKPHSRNARPRRGENDPDPLMRLGAGVQSPLPPGEGDAKHQPKEDHEAE